MNLHQFRFVQEAARRNLNLTETAKALHTSQPGVSKAILELEEELGVDIFVRHGKRLKRMTEPGRQVLRAVEVIMREVANWSSSVRSTLAGSPTKPRSTTRSMLLSGSLTVFCAFSAKTMLPSLPHRPMAHSPSALISATISLLIEPARTISTISTVLASVTRSPPSNFDSMPIFASMAAICGPPPCTTMGFTPDCFSSAMSRAKALPSSILPMAWPPYLMTMVSSS